MEHSEQNNKVVPTSDEQGNTALVLIIDDEPAYRRYLKKVLENFFIVKVLEAGNPKEGFDILKTQRPHLIFMDMQMPIMDGLTMLKHLRVVKETSEIPVIACTALASMDLLSQLVQLRIIDYVVKPISVPQLTDKIRKVFSKIDLTASTKYETNK